METWKCRQNSAVIKAVGDDTVREQKLYPATVNYRFTEDPRTHVKHYLVTVLK